MAFSKKSTVPRNSARVSASNIRQLYSDMADFFYSTAVLESVEDEP